MLNKSSFSSFMQEPEINQVEVIRQNFDNERPIIKENNETVDMPILTSRRNDDYSNKPLLSNKDVDIDIETEVQKRLTEILTKVGVIAGIVLLMILINIIIILLIV